MPALRRELEPPLHHRAQRRLGRVASRSSRSSRSSSGATSDSVTPTARCFTCTAARARFSAQSCQRRAPLALESSHRSENFWTCSARAPRYPSRSMQSVTSSEPDVLTRESAAPPPRKHPAFWVPTLYFAEGLPMITVSVVAALMYKNLGVSNTDIALYTGSLYVPWSFKFAWAPITEMFKTKKHWVVGTELAMAVTLACVALALPLPSFMGLTLAFFWATGF